VEGSSAIKFNTKDFRPEQLEYEMEVFPQSIFTAPNDVSPYYCYFKVLILCEVEHLQQLPSTLDTLQIELFQTSSYQIEYAQH
jgi:hypothetical protein